MIDAKNRAIGLGLWTSVALGFPGAASAQQILLTVESQGEHFLALVNAEGRMLAQTAQHPTNPLAGGGRFLLDGLWVFAHGDEVTLYSPHGERVSAIPLTPGWKSAISFGDGTLAVIDGLGITDIHIYDSAGNLRSNWPYQSCAGGPEWAATPGPNGEVWRAANCGGDIQRHDQNGALLASFPVTWQWNTMFDLSCDDMDADPDGSLWLYHGPLPITAYKFDWSGNVLASFRIPNGTTGLAVADDGTIWVHEPTAHSVHHFNAQGMLLGVTPYDGSWRVTAFDLASQHPTGASFCGPANTNSTGARGSLTALADGASPHVQLVASRLPPGEPGLHLVARSTAFLPGAGGGSGNLCLGGRIGRFVESLWVVPVNGQVRTTIDLDALPMPFGEVAAMAGETWYFQAWYRDHTPAATSNLTDGLALTVK